MDILLTRLETRSARAALPPLFQGTRVLSLIEARPDLPLPAPRPEPEQVPPAEQKLSRPVRELRKSAEKSASLQRLEVILNRVPSAAALSPGGRGCGPRRRPGRAAGRPGLQPNAGAHGPVGAVHAGPAAAPHQRGGFRHREPDAAPRGSGPVAGAAGEAAAEPAEGARGDAEAVPRQPQAGAGGQVGA